jgi:hypothetical protein
MQHFFRFLMMIVVLIRLCSPLPAWALQPAIPNPDKLYQPMQLDLQMTGIPLHLPTYIPAVVKIRSGNPQANVTTLKLPVYAHLDEATPNGYTITIGYSKTCDGGNVCRLGTVVAQRLTNGTPPIDEQYAFMKPNFGFKGQRSPEPMISVNLAQGIQGYFIPWICGATCNDAKVVWDQQGYRYSVGIKVGDQAELMAMANSAIENTISATNKR